MNRCTKGQRCRTAVVRVHLSLLAVLLTLATACQRADDLDAAKLLFVNHCARCHGVEGEGGEGPTLARPVLRHAPDDQALFSVVRDGIGGTGMPENWMLSDYEVQQIASYVRSLAGKSQAAVPGDPERGRARFEKEGQCQRCHIVGGKGIGLGPELTDIGARRGVDYLREAVQHPGSAMPIGPDGLRSFVVLSVVTKDGREVRGARINEDTFTIQLRDVDHRLHSFRKRDLRALRRETDQSLMPSYDLVFGEADLDDLVSYLASLGGE